MATSLATTMLSRAPPSCMSCLRRIGLLEPASSSPFQNSLRAQSRGKKKLAKKTTIHVRLLKDVASYGRKGFIVPVAPARMRNMWFPQGRAAYVTPAEAKASASFIVERDHGFKIADHNELPEDAEQPGAPSIAVSLLSPTRSAQLIQRYVPEVIEFRRQPIQTPPMASQSSAEVESSSGDTLSMAIYGSVSSGDVAARVKAAVADAAATEADAGRLVLAAEDVVFAERLSEDGPVALTPDEAASGRVKTLGEWNVAIVVKGVSDPIVRRVRVWPEAPPEDITSPLDGSVSV